MTIRNNPGRGRFRTAFGGLRVVLPVIHVEDAEQAQRNATVAFEAGADGVFLINHATDWRTLLETSKQVCAACPGRWIGVNCLDLHPTEVFLRVSEDISGIWVDNAEIDERTTAQPQADRIAEAREKSGWPGLYFGGVAFKYQRQVSDLAAAARMATSYIDVVTTSGPGTGQAAERSKVAALRQALGDHPLALASGITPENVAQVFGLADAFLVATGVSTSFTELDPVRTSELIRRVKSRQQGDPRPESPSVCFVCEWNEGRSVHLELVVRHLLEARGMRPDLRSAGLSQGGGVNRLRRDHLVALGIDAETIAAHRSRLFDMRCADADHVLVAEKPMAERLLSRWPALAGRVMTMRGFAMGRAAGNDLSAAEAHIEDADGHPDDGKLRLYAELDDLAARIADRLERERR